MTVNVSGGGSGGEISINVMNNSAALVTVGGPGGDSKKIKSGGNAHFDKLSNLSTIYIERTAYESPILSFLEKGYIPDGEFPNEAYSNEIRTAAEEFMNTMVGEICDSYGYERPYNVDICFDENSGTPAIIIH